MTWDPIDRAKIEECMASMEWMRLELQRTGELLTKAEGVEALGWRIQHDLMKDRFCDTLGELDRAVTQYFGFKGGGYSYGTDSVWGMKRIALQQLSDDLIDDALINHYAEMDTDAHFARVGVWAPETADPFHWMKQNKGRHVSDLMTEEAK